MRYPIGNKQISNINVNVSGDGKSDVTPTPPVPPLESGYERYFFGSLSTTVGDSFECEITPGVLLMIVRDENNLATATLKSESAPVTIEGIYHNNTGANSNIQSTTLESGNNLVLDTDIRLNFKNMYDLYIRIGDDLYLVNYTYAGSGIKFYVTSKKWKNIN